MEYYKLLNLEKEPFSNSPDPDCFFKSRQHQDCLQKLELSLRLRRGLNVVIGDVGTGKTTLCRQLIKKFSRDENFETHLILDPHIAEPKGFLKDVARMFAREPDGVARERGDYKEFIKHYLFKRGVEQNRVVVLIIDEGQKIPVPILEILRELLNYETNEYKLLQIVIFAQQEFEEILDRHANFADRINLLHRLGPLGFRDTRLMIDYRLQKAGSEGSLESMLSLTAQAAIFRATGGFPRKIVNLCHRVMLAMIVKNKKKAGWRLVNSCVNKPTAGRVQRWQKAVGALLVMAGLTGGAYTAWGPEKPVIMEKAPPKQSFPVQNKPVTPLKRPVKIEVATAKAIAEQPQPDVETVTENDGKKMAPGLNTEAVPVEAAPLPEAVVLATGIQPRTLGVIRLRDSETLSWVMIKVYGEYTNLKRREMAMVNPGIKDLDNIFAGQAVRFPATAREGLVVPGYLNWIRVGRVKEVAAALDMVRRFSTKASPMRIIPHWHTDQGLLFDVVFWKYFSSPDRARSYQDRLAEEVRLVSEIISGWEQGTVFYADPCPGIG